MEPTPEPHFDEKEMLQREEAKHVVKNEGDEPVVDKKQQQQQREQEAGLGKRKRKELSVCRNLLRRARQPGVTPATLLTEDMTASEFAWKHICAHYLKPKRPRPSSSSSRSQKTTKLKNNK